MKKILLLCLIATFSVITYAQSAEGTMRVTYRDPQGKENLAEILIKGNNYRINKIAGGAEKYSSYILDNKLHALTCLGTEKPLTAVVFDMPHVLELYEKHNLKIGYTRHGIQRYTIGKNARIINNLPCQEKAAADGAVSYMIWVGTKSESSTAPLISLLRLIGFWGDAENGEDNIVEYKVVKGTQVSEGKVTYIKGKIDDDQLAIPKEYQTVDLNKFISDQKNSPTLPSLVKAFVGL